ncbi:ABC transporter ATP-binding protein [Dermacoccaceae bacterium W4C1]
MRRSGVEVIPGLDLEIPEGTIVGLLGPSGCGKSTVIRCIAGSQVIAGGSVSVLGEPAGSRRNRSRVAYVTQAASVYPDLTVAQNVRYFADLWGADGSAVGAALERVGMADRAQALTGNLSGGQRTRVSLAAALVGEAQVYLLDEPTVGLDPVLRQELWALFADLAQDGRTLLISSHVMDEAARCDRVVLLRAGMLLADDEPRRLQESLGAPDMEAAFLALARAPHAGAGAA